VGATSVLERLMKIPALGKFTLERLKANAFNSFQIPLSTALENQTKTLNHKLERMEKTDIGKKLSIRKGTTIQEISETDYDFYTPFFENPSTYSFMYPLE
jgi:hypothetical protein